MNHRLIYQSVLLLCACCIWANCKPLIYSFIVSPLTITARDSVRINWSVRGKPTLLTHTDSTGQPGFEIREYSLVVEKGGKQASNRAQVNVLPDLSADIIEFDCVRKADTLVAAGEKNNLRWGDHFIIQTSSSFSGRQLLVIHGGRSAKLTADSSMSALFSGLPNNGNWEIKTLLTAAERKDSSLIPGTLQVRTILLFKK
jgi:hypothetical protein